MTETPRRRPTLTPPVVTALCAAFLVAYTFWFYRSALTLGFNTDAFVLIAPQQLSGFVGSLAWDRTYHYLPVLAVWLWVQHLFFGLYEPAYQVVNIAQQGVVALLSFTLTRELSGRRGPALLAALVFTGGASFYEVVYWSLVGSAYHVSTFFYLVGLLAFIRFTKDGAAWRLWSFTACIGLSVFAHELALSLLPAAVTYYLFVAVQPDDRRQFWHAWRSRRVWLDLGKLVRGPAVVIAGFLAVKAFMSQHIEVIVSGSSSLREAAIWFVRGLISAVTFRGDERFVVGTVLSCFGSADGIWVWLVLLCPLAAALFALCFTRVERFLFLWLLGQLLVTLLAVGAVAPRHLYVPTLVAAILVVVLAARFVGWVLAAVRRRTAVADWLELPLISLLLLPLCVLPAWRDAKGAERPWQLVSSANVSLKATLSEAVAAKRDARHLTIVNATRFLWVDGFAAYTFQNGLWQYVAMSFPGQFTSLRLVHFFPDESNVAAGSRRTSPSDIDLSSLDDDGSVFLMYLPDEFRFIELTRDHFAEEGLARLAVEELPLVYTPESAPSLDWVNGDSPFLNFLGALPMRFRTLPSGQVWLGVLFRAEEGRDTDLQVGGQVIGTLAAQPGRAPTWRSQTFPLPAGQAQAIELSLVSRGPYPSNVGRVGVFEPQQVYTSDTCPALLWDGEGSLTVVVGTSLTLPMRCPPDVPCALELRLRDEPGRAVTLSQGDGEVVAFAGPPVPTAKAGWARARAALPRPGDQVITLAATGTKDVVVNRVRCVAARAE